MTRKLKSTELRIGNLVNYGTGRPPQEVTGSDLLEGVEGRPFSGIEFTPAWLDIFGFNRESNGIWHTKGNISVNGIGGYVQIGASVVTQGCVKRIEFIHELQNLYFAVTGEELKSK